MKLPIYSVAVRELCEFAAKQGDLDLRFTPSPTALQGIAGHKTVASRRGVSYQSEVSLSGRYQGLQVRGRADGYDPDRELIEEIKTFKSATGEPSALPENHRALHWAQAKVYGWLICERFGLKALTVSVVYFEIGTRKETALAERHSAAELRAFFDALCERFLGWAMQEHAHRQARDAALTTLPFPHASFRTGQRPLAEAVFRAARSGRCLMAQAPTGIGKTIGSVFPLLKACPEQALDKIFFLSAKGSGRALALDAVDALRRATPALPLRVIELVARDKACEHPDKSCHGDSCPLAKGFYDRLPTARAAAVVEAANGPLAQQRLRAVAAAHAVCPYYLSQEMVRWSDLVVGDYNYFFDTTALLHGLTLANQWRIAVLVDEAHNLVERARSMYSAALDSVLFRQARAVAPVDLRLPLARVSRAWNALTNAQTEAYRVHDTLPAKLISTLQDVTAAITELLAEPAHGISGTANAALLRFYFDALQFTRLVDSFGNHSLFDVSLRQAAGSVLCIRNVLPAPFLKPRFAATRTSVLFSATLAPDHFYAETLGLPADTAWIDVEAPFDSSQLKVHIVRELSTRYRDRAASLAPIARLMAVQYEREPGNYLAFFSSFEYLKQVADELDRQSPTLPRWEQTRAMGESDRAAFLARFTSEGRGIGFAVLGGAFAEGIDLTGTRLIGAFIATLGLPQLNPVNEEMRRRMDAMLGSGYDYTYLYPGLRKVVQAAGRVIRAPLDRGSLYLIDDRFARPEVMRLLPRWWRLEVGTASVV